MATTGFATTIAAAMKNARIAMYAQRDHRPKMITWTPVFPCLRPVSPSAQLRVQRLDPSPLDAERMGEDREPHMGRATTAPAYGGG